MRREVRHLVSGRMGICFTEGEFAMLRRFLSLAVLLIVLNCASNLRANTLLFATLSNAAENPPTNPTLTTGAPRPASFGTATFDLNTAQTAMTFTATIFNIDVTGSQTADTN